MATDNTRDQRHPSERRISRWGSQAVGAAACLYSLVTLLGWWLQIDFLQRIIPGAVPIHPHTASTFVVLSGALLLSPWLHQWQQRIAMVFAVSVAAVGSLRIFATLSGHSLWVGDPLIAQGAAVMAMSTAIVFLCLGVGCLCMLASRGGNWTLGMLLSLVSIGFGSMAAFGHLFKAGSLYSINGEVMSLPTAILCLLVGFGFVSSRPPEGVVSLAVEGVRSTWLNLSIRYKCLAVVAIPVACLVFEIGWQIRVLNGLNDAQQWITHTQQVELTVVELQRLLLQIESNDRGYGLSGSKDFLLPLSQQEAQVPAVVLRLSRLVEDNPAQLVRARNLEELSRTKLNFAQDVVTFFANNRNSARAPVMRMRLLESKARMDDFMDLSRVFAAEEERLLAKRMERVKQQEQLSHRVLVLTIATGFGAGILAVFIFSWSVADRLTTLKDDSRHIAKGEITPAPPPGEDEVSKLAWSLHSASHKICDQMQGLAALNRDLESFSYSVSHDLRSPLRHIHGFSKILKADFSAELPAEAQRYLSRIESGAERMGRLIDDLLNFSRIGRREIDRQAVALRPIVQNVVEELSDGTDRKVEWQIEPLPSVHCDPALMKQVLANLLGNALKFTRTRDLARIEVGSRDLPQGTAIYVRDNGVGFDMQFADKLFGVFQRLHRLEEFEGTGVGLATVARIIHKHGGSVWAESTPEQGAAFYFTLGEVAAPLLSAPRQRTQEEVLYAAAR